MVDVAAVKHYPDVLRAFRTERPDVEMMLSVAPSAALLAALRSGELDLIVCVEPPDWPAGIESEPLLSEPIRVFAPVGTEIAAPATWGPWVIFPRGSHTRFQIVQHLTSLGSPVDVAADSHQTDVLRQMVSLGLGWTVLPESAADGALVVGPAILDRRLVIARRTGAIHDPAADELAERLIAIRNHPTVEGSGATN
jgi:DNA-binding transcriptional LysR family regulator